MVFILPIMSAKTLLALAVGITCVGGVFLVPTSAFIICTHYLATATFIDGGFTFTNQAFTNVHTHAIEHILATCTVGGRF